MPTNAIKKTDANSRAYVLQRITAEAKRRLHKNSTGLMNETINPLWNINERQAQLIYDFARTGNYAQIQYLYNEIEERDPTLLVCVTRRTSAVAELDWRVVRSDERRYRNADKVLIKEQKDCIETAMARIDNMPDALEHLALSAFRGFSVVAPVHSVDGDIRHLDLIDSWNLCWDRRGQSWYFNPSASSFAMPTIGASTGGIWVGKGLEYIPPEQICAVTRKREIDWPAMQIYLRSAIGERDWGRFLETYGLPPVIITMPEFTSEKDQEAYIQAAADVFEGRSGVVPYGSQVNYASESRGTNPFTDFIEHQQKLVVMMATGGTLASLSEATGIGGGASDIQQDEWKRIIRADKRIISNAINKQICEVIIRSNKDFKGKPILAEFQLDDTPKPTAKEMLELASTAASAGFEMDAEELSQACGFTLRKKVEGGNDGFWGGDPDGGGHGSVGGNIGLIPDQTDSVDSETVTNADDWKGDPDAINSTGGSIVSKMKRLITEDDSRGTNEASRYWDKLTIDDWDNAIRHVMSKLPKGAYNKARLSGIVEKALGLRAAVRFDGNWERYYNWFTTREPERYYAPTTHGLDGFTVKNDKPALSPSDTPSDAISDASDDKETPPAPTTPAPRSSGDAGMELVGALQKDFKPVAERLVQILSLPENERAAEAQRMIVELPSLVPDDPAMAEVIAEQMQGAFAEQLSKDPNGNAPAANKVVPNAEKLDFITIKGAAVPLKSGKIDTSCEAGKSIAKSEEEKKAKAEAVAKEPMSEQPNRSVKRFRTSDESNRSAISSGYKSTEDLLAHAEKITNERVQEILTSEHPSRITAAEGIGVIASNPTLHDADGRKMVFGKNQIEKYCTGRYRGVSKKTNIPLGPKVSNFENVSFLINAIRTDVGATARLKFPKGSAIDPIDTPMGTQRHYIANTDKGPINVFVYVKSTKDPNVGVINGWYVEGDNGK